MDPGMFGAGWTPGSVRICQDRRRISTMDCDRVTPDHRGIDTGISTMDRHRIDEGIPTMPL
jgi:hypothetical protein